MYLCTRFRKERTRIHEERRLISGVKLNFTTNEINELSRDSEVFYENREVAQLVAHHVRDVGVGCSSHLFSTERRFWGNSNRFLYRDAMNKELVRIWGRYIGWVVSAAALAYLVYRLVTYPEYASLGEQLRLSSWADYPALLVALALVPLPWWVETCRWQAMLQGLVSVSRKEAWEQVMSGLIAGFVTPYRLGEYPARLAHAGVQREIDWWNWRSWLTDWRKWCVVMGWTLLRYVVWGTQLWMVLRFCGIMLTPWQAVSSIAVYYFCISVFPSVPVAEVASKGGWAVLIFSKFTSHVPQIAIAVALIWFINTILPILFVYFKKMYYLCTRKAKRNENNL